MRRQELGRTPGVSCVRTTEPGKAAEALWALEVRVNYSCHESGGEPYAPCEGRHRVRGVADNEQREASVPTDRTCIHSIEFIRSVRVGWMHVP
jgi:hypothetical protein